MSSSASFFPASSGLYTAGRVLGATGVLTETDVAAMLDQYRVACRGLIITLQDVLFVRVERRCGGARGGFCEKTSLSFHLDFLAKLALFVGREKKGPPVRMYV